MISYEDVNKIMSAVSGEYLQLQEKFGEFASLIACRVIEPDYPIKGISTSLHLTENYFTATFAGRTIRFEFRASIENNIVSNGVVYCYLIPYFPEKDPIPLSSFTFTKDGLTQMTEPEDNDCFLNITYNTASLCIVLNIFNDVLAGNAG